MIVIFCIVIIAFPSNKENLAYANIAKQEMVRTMPAPRIIFIGGSNLAFGLNSPEVKDSTGRNVINAGIHAGYGLKQKIDEVNNKLRSSDCVVISPEYTHFFGNGAYGGPRVLPTLLEVCPEIIKDFNRQQIATIIRGLPKLFHGRIEYFKSLHKSKSGEYEEKASNYDKYGDEVLHLTMKIPQKKILTPPIKDDFNEDFFAYFIQRLKEWQKRGLTVVILPPAYYDKGFNENKAKIDYLTKRLAESGYPFAAPPEEFSYPRNLIYNTHYHLNKEGRELRTKSVIKALRNI